MSEEDIAPETGRKAPVKWLWLLAVVVLFLLIVLWVADPLGGADNGVPAGEATPEVTATVAPAAAGVPVTLPDTEVQTPEEAAPAPAETPTG